MWYSLTLWKLLALLPSWTGWAPWFSPHQCICHWITITRSPCQSHPMDRPPTVQEEVWLNCSCLEWPILFWSENGHDTLTMVYHGYSTNVNNTRTNSQMWILIRQRKIWDYNHSCNFNRREHDKENPTMDETIMILMTIQESMNRVIITIMEVK